MNKINEIIKAAPTSNRDSNSSGVESKAVAADVFRANIVVAEDSHLRPGTDSLMRPLEHPFVEDAWRALRVGTSTNNSTTQPSPISASETDSRNTDSARFQFDVLGPCARCQMVCVDQRTGQRGTEPFATLSKTRKVGGKVLFGKHVCVSSYTFSSLSWERDDGIRHAEDSGVWVRVGDAVTPVYEGE